MSTPASNSLTEREIKTLYKLLDKFKRAHQSGVGSAQAGDFNSLGEQSIIGTVRQWVKWYADENTEVEL